jgi:transposase InsO family protein
VGQGRHHPQAAGAGRPGAGPGGSAVQATHRAYGAPRVTAELNATAVTASPGTGDVTSGDSCTATVGVARVNRKRVARVTREHHLTGIRLRRPRPRPQDCEQDPTAVPDLVHRDFTAAEQNRTYICDITYLPLTCGGFLFLATVIDCYSRRLVGFEIADHQRADLVVAALDNAAATRGSLHGAIIHSDHGSQYTSQAHANACQRLGTTRSMSAVGSSADNTLAESFNATLKRELLHDKKSWATAHECRTEVFARTIDYNAHRRHAHCGHLSPTNDEQQTPPTKLPKAA